MLSLESKRRVSIRCAASVRSSTSMIADASATITGYRVRDVPPLRAVHEPQLAPVPPGAHGVQLPATARPIVPAQRGDSRTASYRPTLLGRVARGGAIRERCEFAPSL